MKETEDRSGNSRRAGEREISNHQSSVAEDAPAFDQSSSPRLAIGGESHAGGNGHDDGAAFGR